MTPENQNTTPVPTKKHRLRVIAAAAIALALIVGTLLTRDSMPRTQSELNGTTAAATTRAAKSAAVEDYGAVYADTAVYAEEASVADVDYEASASTSGSSAQTDGAAAAAQERKLIRTVNLTMNCADLDAAMSALTASCNGLGGYVSSSGVSTYRDSRSGWLTLRVPADALDTFLAGADSAGRVTGRSEDVEDVTDSYYDIASRLATQQTLLERMRELAAGAETMADLL